MRSSVRLENLIANLPWCLTHHLHMPETCTTKTMHTQRGSILSVLVTPYALAFSAGIPCCCTVFLRRTL